MNFQENLNLYRENPNLFKKMNKDVVNEYSVLNRARTAEFDQIEQQIIAGSLTQSQMQEALMAAPRMFNKIYKIKESIQETTQFALMTPEQRKALRRDNQAQYGRLQELYHDVQIYNALKTATLVPEIMQLTRVQKERYLPLVIAKGSQIKEYWAQGNFIEYYKKASAQHTQTQQFVLSQSAEHIFYTQIPAPEKIAFLDKNKSVILKFLSYLSHVEPEVEAYCVVEAAKIFNQELKGSQSVNLKSLQPFFYQRACEILHEQGMMQGLLSTSVSDSLTQMNLAQHLYMQEQFSHSFLSEHYSELLLKPIVQEHYYLRTNVNLERILWDKRLYKRILQLDGTSTEYFVAAALNQPNPQEYLRVEHLEHLQKMKLDKPELVVILERLKLQQNLESGNAARTFKL